MLKRFVGPVLICALASAGCKLGKPPSSDPDAPPLIVGLSLNPGSLTVGVGHSVAVTILATWDDGRSIAVAAEWSVVDSGIATLVGGTGASILVEGVAVGVTQVRASYQGYVATQHVTVIDWQPAQLKGPVYGQLGGGGPLRRYDADGTPQIFYSGLGGCFGLAAKPDGSKIYVSGALPNSTTRVIATIDANAGPGDAAHIVPIPGGTGPYGLDVAPDGRLLFQSLADSTVFWLDPETDLITPAGKLKIGNQISLAVAPTGAILSTPIIANPGWAWEPGSGSPWVYIQDPHPTTPTSRVFTWVPDAIATQAGNVTFTSMAVDDGGEVFLVNYEGRDVYRALDVNGDGLAHSIDDGEMSRFATIPGAWPQGKGGICGLCNAGGRRGLLVNAMRVDGQATADTGLYFVTDLDGDGDCDDAGEMTLFSTAPASNDPDTGCVVSVR